MAGEDPRPLDTASLSGLRLGVLQGMPLQGLDETVSARFADALGRLGAAGVRLTDETVTLLDDMAAVNAKGGLAPPEALSIHRQLLKARGADVDPNVRARIERAGSISAADYVDMAQARTRLTRAMDARLADLDALVMPTTPIVAPENVRARDAGHLRAQKRRAAAQSGAGQFLRPLRHLSAAAADRGCRPA